MEIHKTFPTLIGYKEDALSEEENDRLLTLVYDLKKSMPSNGKQDWLSGDNSPYTSIHLHNIIKDQNFSFFTQKISNHVHHYSKCIGDKSEYVCSDGWVNVYAKNNYQEPHVHTYNMYSAVYYAKAPVGSGDLVFMNPSNFIFTNGADNECPTKIYTPKPRLLIIFRSTLMHYVLHNSTNENRVSVALNYSLSKELYAKFMNYD